MRAIEFVPSIAKDDILKSAAFLEADWASVLLEDWERTIVVEAELDCRNRRQTNDFVLRLKGDPMIDGNYRCYLRAKRTSTPRQKVWVVQCHCGHKITKSLYYLPDTKRFGCKICLKLQTFKTNKLYEKIAKAQEMVDDSPK